MTDDEEIDELEAARSQALMIRGALKRKRTKRRFLPTTLYIRPDQLIDLAQISAETGLSQAEFLRRAIDAALDAAFARPKQPPPLRAKLLKG